MAQLESLTLTSRLENFSAALTRSGRIVPSIEVFEGTHSAYVSGLCGRHQQSSALSGLVL